MKKSIVALFTALAIIASPAAFSAQNSKGSQNGASSNIENQTSIFEGTDLGKYRAEWSKGRTIEPGESVQCWNSNLMRGGLTDPACKK